MKKTLSWIAVTSVVFLASTSPAAAADQGSAPFYGNAIAAGIGVGLTIIGAGIGFGKIGASALESMARQPEVAERIGQNMIVIAALLEGATFISLIVCMIAVFRG